MRVHALESTDGQVYAEMPRAVDAETGDPIPDEEAGAALAAGTAVDNPERQIWVTQTALATALNTSYFAEQVAAFSIVVGIALVLIGIGLLVLTYGVCGPAWRGLARRSERAPASRTRSTANRGTAGALPAAGSPRDLSQRRVDRLV
jgi:hypothetical protein